MKILLITSMPWREDNNIGNSYSNLFNGINNIEIAHIYCRDGKPQNNIVHKYFQITESALIKNLINKKHKTGNSFYLENPMNSQKEIRSATYDKMRILRWQIFFLGRDLLWEIGRWKTPELDNFVSNYKPDLIFSTLTYMPNINKMLVHLKDKYNIPLILYSWDDVYSLKQFSISPIYWIRKLYQRKYIRSSVKRSEFLYTITKEMQNEYTAYFHKECKLLYKSYNFNIQAPVKNKVSNPIKLIFMGNIGAGRWKALSKLAKTVAEINQNKKIAFFDIYTLSPMSKQMKRQLEIGGSSKINPVVPSSEVLKVQRSADILVHVEPYNKAEASFYRLSFSTKLVDYFYSARCIIGLGRPTATLSYIKGNDCGIVFEDLNNLKNDLLELLYNKEKILNYSLKSWECGVRNHQREKVQNDLITTLKQFSQRTSL